MIWFGLAVLVAAGGIWAFYSRSKRMTAADAAAVAAVAAHQKAAASTDGARININSREDIERWTKELGVDEWDLKGAVQDAGPSADAVRKHLAEK